MLCFSLVCKAQEDRGNIADSMAMVSRTKADKVLQHFDTIIAPKLLYSLDNKDFYVIIKSNPCYQEYYVALDSLGRIDKMRPVKAETKTRKQRKQQEQYQQLLSEAEPIFDLTKYHTDFITKMPDIKYTSGRYSYFVLKDIDGKRYGEYRLSAVTSPLPINASLWAYLIRRLSDEAYKDNKPTISRQGTAQVMLQIGSCQNNYLIIKKDFNHQTLRQGGSLFLSLMNGRDNKSIRIFWKVMPLIGIFMFDTPILKGTGNKWERTTLNN